MCIWFQCLRLDYTLFGLGCDNDCVIVSPFLEWKRYHYLPYLTQCVSFVHSFVCPFDQYIFSSLYVLALMDKPVSWCFSLSFSAYSPNFASSVLNLLDYFLGHGLRKYFSFQQQHKIVMLLVLKTDSKNISATFNRAYPPYLDVMLNSLTIIQQSVQRMSYLLSIYK